MQARLSAALARAAEVERELADPATARQPDKLRALGREHARLDRIRVTANRLAKLTADLSQARALAADPDAALAELAQADIARVEPEIAAAAAELQDLLVPRDPLDDRDTIIEIRAGTGGDEAALFAADLLRMYLRYAERRGWKTELVALSAGNVGGVREAIA